MQIVGFILPFVCSLLSSDIHFRFLLFLKELDWESIAAGLLHDTVEDTDIVTFDRIEKEFGKAVRNIVEGETKVLSLFFFSYEGRKP